MKILVHRSDAIGDTLLTTSLARAIKAKNPKVHVAYLVASATYPLITHCEGVDQVYAYNKKESLKHRINQLQEIFREEKPDIFIHGGGSLLPVVIAFLLGVPQRGGLLSRWWSFLFLNKGVRQSRSTENKHETQWNREFCVPLGLEVDSAMTEPLLQFQENLEEEFEIQFQKYFPEISLSKKGEKKWVAIHPGMTGHSLNWSVENYGSLAEELLNDERVTLFFTYTPSDAFFIDPLKEKFRHHAGFNQRLFFLDGSLLGLVGFGHFLQRCQLFIGGSTGTTHMANALGIAQIAFYSPIKAQSEQRWGPTRRDHKVRVFSPQVECGQMKTCLREKCPHYFCMDKKIAVADVLAQALTLLESP